MRCEICTCPIHNYQIYYSSKHSFRRLVILLLFVCQSLFGVWTSIFVVRQSKLYKSIWSVSYSGIGLMFFPVKILWKFYAIIKPLLSILPTLRLIIKQKNMLDEIIIRTCVYFICCTYWLWFRPFLLFWKLKMFLIYFIYLVFDINKFLKTVTGLIPESSLFWDGNGTLHFV